MIAYQDGRGPEPTVDEFHWDGVKQITFEKKLHGLVGLAKSAAVSSSVALWEPFGGYRHLRIAAPLNGF
jgi:hypothetical protein